MPFSDEERDRIAGMIQLGWSRRKIADVFGMGRNAFIGRIFRDKKLRGIASPPKEPPKPRERRKSVPSLPPRMKIVAGRPQPVRKEPPPPAPEMRKVPLVELGRGECNWPVIMDSSVPGGHLFCGAAAQHLQNWCPYHHYIGYTPRAKAVVR